MLVDALNHATAGSETYPPELYLPAGARAHGGRRRHGRGAIAGHACTTPSRSSAGRCATPTCSATASATRKPTIVQTLYLANHPAVQQKIAIAAGPRRPDRQGASPTTSKRIEELFLWTLSRLPTDAERQTCLKYVKDSASPQRGLEDVLWSLLNTQGIPAEPLTPLAGSREVHEGRP